MAIRIHKQGLMDTIQDGGRYGFQHWGINPGGAMDSIAMQVANMLVGNPVDEAVIEMHFPAAEMVFETEALVALAGADLGAELNSRPFPANHPALVNPGDILRFSSHRAGSRVYLAVRGGLQAESWLGSCSTGLRTKKGGLQGRAFQKNDQIVFKNTFRHGKPTHLLPWQAGTETLYRRQPLRFIPGAEYAMLNEDAREQLHTAPFLLSRRSDRMGYRLQGAALESRENRQLISTAVTRGTIQLLPDGQLIILMADHQTTGGYPRIGHLISADMPALSQRMPGEEIRFRQSDLMQAEAIFEQQQTNLRLLQNACTLRLQEYLRQ